MPDDLATLITQIHATDTVLVLEFAGAGAQALHWLHGVGGSSRTILEATDRYAPASLVELLGYHPSPVTTPAVAQAMAMQACQRARHLLDEGDSDRPIIGVGCTATIATDRSKQGDHRVCVAWSDGVKVRRYSLTMTKGARSRAAEEALVSRLIVQAIADGCQVEATVALNLLAGEAVHDTVAP